MLEIQAQQRKDAVLSLQQYAERNLPEPLGDLAAGLLLDFFLQEVGPVVYNQAVADAQGRLQARIADLEGELYEEPFTFWSAKRAAATARRHSR